MEASKLYRRIWATYGECVLATAAKRGRSLDSILKEKRKEARVFNMKSVHVFKTKTYKMTIILNCVNVFVIRIKLY